MAITTEFDDNQEAAIELILSTLLSLRNKKVVQRDALTDVQDSDILPIVRGLNSNRINWGVLKTALNASVVNASFASLTGAPTDNTPLVNYIAQEIANNPAVDVLATVLAGLVTTNDSVIQTADTLIIALGKLQAQITANEQADQIAVSPSGNLTSTNAQAAFLELQGDIDAIGQAIVIRGNWDASTGVFPGGGTAQTGDAYIVSVAGTVDSVDFGIGDKIIALVDNASTTTFDPNWFKQDNTEDIQTASEVPTSPITGVTGTEVQTMLASLKTLIDGNATPTTTKGDIEVNDGTDLGRLPAGANGEVPVYDSSETLGIATRLLLNTFTQQNTSGAVSVDAANHAMIAREIFLTGDMNSLSFTNASNLRFAILQFDSDATRNVAVGAGNVIDESNNENNQFTLTATQNTTMIGWYDGAVWHWTRSTPPSTSGIQDNFSGTAAPGATDDTNAGYSKGSRWLDETNDILWFCTDATASSAVWIIETQYGLQALTDGATVTYDTNLGPKAELTSPASNRTVNLTNLPSGISREGYLNIKNTNGRTIQFQVSAATTNVYIVNDGKGDTAQGTTAGATSRDSFAWVWDGTDLQITYLPNFTQT